MLLRHLNFRQVSHRFTSSFANPSFQDLNGSHIMHWNMIILNPSRFKVEPHSKYWYFCIERWDLLSLRFSEKRRAISHWMAVPKNRGKCKSATTGVTHWACPAPLVYPEEVGTVKPDSMWQHRLPRPLQYTRHVSSCTAYVLPYNL